MRGWGWGLGMILLAAATGLRGQTDFGAITGTIIESWEGKPLPGVTITVRGTTLATSSDGLGRYELRQVPPGDHALRFSKPGYATAVVTDVRVLAGQSTKVDGVLRPEFYDLEEYEVTAEVFEEQAVQLLQERQQASALLEAIGSEQFSRVGAGDAADIISKVPGITVTDGKHPVVRGLNERYVGVQLNGAEVPSADPYRKSVQLDVFPAKLIDRVVVNKTFTPDQPGNFTGGGVNVVTKSFPEEFFANVEAGVEYNTRATFNEKFLSYAGGDKDWLGLDDGTRALPGPLAAPDLVVPFPVSSLGRPGSASYEQNLARANQLRDLTVAMGTTVFAPRRAAPPPNHQLAVSFGDTVPVLDRPFGFFGGLSYKRSFSFQEGISRRYRPALGSGIELRRDYADVSGSEEVNWASVVNLAYRLHDNHEVSFNFLFTQNAEDVARQQTGTSTDDPGFVFHLNRLQFTERNLQTYQLKGTHTLPEVLDLKVDWLAAWSDTSQDEPDARFFHYREVGGAFELGHASIPSPRFPTRYFRALAENNKNGKLDLTLPFAAWNSLEGALKLGTFGSLSAREFSDREIFYGGNSDAGSAFPFTGDPNSFLTDASLGYTLRTNRSGTVSVDWHRYVQARDSVYTGNLDISAGYAMLDLPVLPRLRVVGGVRYELTAQSVASRSYIANAITGLSVNDSALEQTDLLPAAGLTYTIITNMNVRFSYSRTLARPSFRELAGYRSYDPVLNELLDGNPRLRLSRIENFDLRWEWFPSPGDTLAVSLFYKDLQDAIEKQFITTDAEIVSWDNRKAGKVYGVEFEVRKNLGFLGDFFDGFGVGANAALIESEVALTPVEVAARTLYLGDDSGVRPLYDQSPYIINLDVTYDNVRTGTRATVAYSVYGPRITIAGLATPDVYEQPAPVVDFLLSQTLGKHCKVKFSAKNLLDPLIERTYGRQGDSFLYTSFRKGRTFGLSLSWEF